MTRPPASTWTTALLDDLLAHPLDPGYQAAADRAAARAADRARDQADGQPEVGTTTPLRARWDRPLVAVVCALIGFALVVAYQQTHRSAPARDAARKDLISRINALQQAGDRLDNTARTLGTQVGSLRDAQLAGGDSAALRNLEVASGSVAVHGPGLEIRVADPTTSASADSSGRVGEGGTVLHDTDLRDVVNQLWRSGAEAIAVNGIRLSSTSAIRFAGDAVLVDLQPITSPYTIAAIGDQDTMLVQFADSRIAQRLKTEQSVYGISFDFNGKSNHTLPAVPVSVPRFADPGASPSGVGSSNSPSVSSPTASPSNSSRPSPSATETSR